MVAGLNALKSFVFRSKINNQGERSYLSHVYVVCINYIRHILDRFYVKKYPNLVGDGGIDALDKSDDGCVRSHLGLAVLKGVTEYACSPLSLLIYPPVLFPLFYICTSLSSLPFLHFLSHFMSLRLFSPPFFLLPFPLFSLLISINFVSVFFISLFWFSFTQI